METTSAVDVVQRIGPLCEPVAFSCLLVHSADKDVARNFPPWEGIIALTQPPQRIAVRQTVPLNRDRKPAQYVTGRAEYGDAGALHRRLIRRVPDIDKWQARPRPVDGIV